MFSAPIILVNIGSLLLYGGGVLGCGRLPEQPSRFFGNGIYEVVKVCLGLCCLLGFQAVNLVNLVSVEWEFGFAEKCGDRW